MNAETKPESIEKLEVIEEKDGSVTVELPESMQSPDPQDEERHAEGGDVNDDDHPDDTDAIREARRNRRKAKKEYIKRTNQEKDQRLTLITRRNQELEERINSLERKTHGADIARFDKAIEDEKYRYQYAQKKMQEATDNSDGAALIKFQEMWYDSRRKIESMEDYKVRATQNTSNDSGPANPRLVRLAKDWMERNDWYDPNAKDEDTEIAKVIDNRLVAEGWNPETEEYWDELDNRLQKRLPHRYTYQDDDTSRRRPRSVVTGSGRESVRRGGGNSFVLEPEQVRAMKDAGYWDDPVKRDNMIKRYAANARNNRS
jgi:hypothetical protein